MMPGRGVILRCAQDDTGSLRMTQDINQYIVFGMIKISICCAKTLENHVFCKYTMLQRPQQSKLI
jgi:hypothetical protein